MPTQITRPRFLASRHGAVLFDARQPFNEIEIAIDGPGMRVRALQLVTSLSVFDGYEYGALRQIADDLNGFVRCGHTHDGPVSIEVKGGPLGPVLEVGVGPMGMYTSLLELSTKSGSTLASLLDQKFATFAGEVGLPTDYFAAFQVIGLQGVSHGGHQSGGHQHDGQE